MTAIKKHIRKPYLLRTAASAFCFFICTASFGQSSSASIDTVAANPARGVPGEKIFIHTDKDFYVPGETIWFKVYDVQAEGLKPSSISKVAYVELLSADNRPALQGKVRLNKGKGHGSFVVPSTANTGHYLLRAYTAWMKNFDPERYFTKTITLANMFKTPDWASLERPASYTVRFFPEGGELVSGLASRVAFKAVDQYGNGIACKGVIVDQRHDTITRFETLKFGMGSFLFTPVTGSSYKVIFTNLPQDAVNATFPEVKAEGYVMRVTRTESGQISVAVLAKGSYDGPMFLINQTGGQVTRAMRNLLVNGYTAFLIDTSALTGGVTTFTILDSHKQPVCERLFFKRPPAGMQVDVRTDSTAYYTRSKVQLTIRPAVNHAPQKADLSLSVYSIDSLQQRSESDIYQYLWLTSELKGLVESPGYYFNKNGPERDDATDNLMLTQGWRRFRTEPPQRSLKTKYEYLPEYEGPIVTATITDKGSDKPVPGATAYLSIPGQPFHFSSAVSDDSGKVHFVPGESYGPGELVLSASPGNAYNIDISNSFSTYRSAWVPTSFYLPSEWKEQLLLHGMSSQVQHHFNADSFEIVGLPKDADTTPFYGVPDKTYLLENYTRFPTMEEVMREFVMDVRVRKENGRFLMQTINIPYQAYFSENPLVLLDGVPVPDVDKIFAFDPLKVKRIDVVARKFVHGNIAANGIVSYFTYNGDLANFDLDPGAVVLDYQGLQFEREFYAPIYNGSDQLNSRLPDNRNVLLWSPEVKADAHGNYDLQFFTSDIPGNYVVVVQGMDDQGKAGSTVITFSVRQRE